MSYFLCTSGSVISLFVRTDGMSQKDQWTWASNIQYLVQMASDSCAVSSGHWWPLADTTLHTVSTRRHSNLGVLYNLSEIWKVSYLTLSETLSSVFFILFFILTNYRLERRLYVKLKDWMSNSVDQHETAHWAVSSGSMLFAKAYYDRMWQWKSQFILDWINSSTLYIGRVEFQFRYFRLCDLDIPREKWLKFFITVETLNRRIILLFCFVNWRLLWHVIVS